MNDPMDKLAVYVHWPYCTRICPYCDFNVYKGGRDENLLDAILQDLSSWRTRTGPREITSIHFGGGTPSLMSAENVQSLIKTVDQLWGLRDEIEIGLEANPQDSNEVLWQNYAQAGINRMSLGVQSFHDPALKFLGRDHDAARAKDALSLAQEIFPNFSMDLIFGWAGQTESLLRSDLETALSFDPAHLSTYQLTLEPGTAFERAARRGEVRAVDDDISADFYDLVRAVITEAYYEHYEVSNYARNGLRSQHNSAYWQGLDYVGVGPGAHGRLTQDGIRRATVAPMKPKDYINNLTLLDGTVLSPQDWATEYLLMGLRISEGISLARYKAIKGETLAEELYADFLENNYLTLMDGRLMATEKGRPVLDYITKSLTAGD